MKRLIAGWTAGLLLCSVCYGANVPEIGAASAVLMDAESGRVLYEKDPHTRRLIASTTKLMTALVAVESTPDLSTAIPIKREYQAEGSSMYLEVGEELTLEELLYGLLLASGNDAALAIADGCAGSVKTFVEWMNQRAESLGMRDTHFANPNGLDQEGHYSTAYDMALLAQAVLENEFLMQVVSTRSANVAGRSLTNHNKLLWRYDGCRGMKTGYTDGAGRTLVTCARRGEQMLICVTLKDRDDWKDHAVLFDYGFESFPSHILCTKNRVFRSVRVSGSLLSQTEVVTASDVSYPLAEGEQVQAHILLPVCVNAPVRKGGIAGKLTFRLGEKNIGESYLLYVEDVPENRPRSSLLQRLRALFSAGGSLAAFLLDHSGAAS